eukprot:5124926-Pleurochrysis_carterae.AAC.1
MPPRDEVRALPRRDRMQFTPRCVAHALHSLHIRCSQAATDENAGMTTPALAPQVSAKAEANRD